MKQIISFIKNRFEEVNPWSNIKLLSSNLRGDIISGITVAIIALPLALAFGEMSQLGPIAGIWSAVIGGIIGGVFGGCLVGVSGPTAPMASQIAAFMGAFVIGTTNEPDLVAAFSIIFLSGLILVIISMLKISHFINYIPYSAIAGFMCGIGVIIIFSQINPFLGLESKGSTYDIITNFSYSIQNISFEVLYVSIPSLLIVLLWPLFIIRFSYLSYIPSPLIALIVGTSIAYFMNLNIPYIGDKMDINESSKVLSFYFPDLSRISEFIGPACALAGLAVLDSLLSCKVADNMTGTKHNSDREAFGQGMANMFAGLMGGISTATATTQTVGNITFGAKTPLATIIKGVTLLAVLFGLGFLVAAIPNACLAAILFKLGIDILDYRVIPLLRKLPKMDLLIFIIVLLITVYKDLMVAVGVGVIFAAVYCIKEIIIILKSNYNYKSIPLLDSDFFSNEDTEKKLNNLSINILQPQGPLFFGSIEKLLKDYGTSAKHKILILDINNITMIDLSGAYALEDLINNLKLKNIKVILFNKNIRIENFLDKINFINNIGKDYYKNSKESVLSAILKFR